MIPDFDLFPVYDNNGKTVLATLPKAKYGRYDVIIVWGGYEICYSKMDDGTNAKRIVLHPYCSNS